LTIAKHVQSRRTRNAKNARKYRVTFYRTQRRAAATLTDRADGEFVPVRGHLAFRRCAGEPNHQ
jgi:hypothetical protein